VVIDDGSKTISAGELNKQADAFAKE